MFLFKMGTKISVSGALAFSPWVVPLHVDSPSIPELSFNTFFFLVTMHPPPPSQIPINPKLITFLASKMDKNLKNGTIHHFCVKFTGYLLKQSYYAVTNLSLACNLARIGHLIYTLVIIVFGWKYMICWGSWYLFWPWRQAYPPFTNLYYF